jgi:putative ABC transport system ATP-binding protein
MLPGGLSYRRRRDGAGHAHRPCDGIHAMIDTVVEAVDVVKLLGKGAAQVQALKGVSLALKGGELTLLMGPSGSGKTTLLSILGCLLTPTCGTVRMGGRSTEGAGPEELAKLRREHVGFIFQSYHLFPTLTATDNARDALAMVDLSHKTNAFPLELSGGEQQRVAIARAIVGEPSAVLADEPTASLDGENGNAIMTLLAEIAKDRSRGVLVVAHDPRILRFADRVVHIEDAAMQRSRRMKATALSMITPKSIRRRSPL